MSSTAHSRLLHRRKDDPHPRFFPMLHLPRARAAVRRKLHPDATRARMPMSGCSNGSVLTHRVSFDTFKVAFVMHRPLCMREPPHGVSIDLGKTTMLSRADDGSVLCLIHINELQLQIWLHNGDNWSLLDTICLSEMCANMLEDVPTADIRINHVGDYNDFVFLEMGRCVLYLDVKSRTLRKVYEMTADEYHLGDIYPFMMSWPPIFPTLSPARSKDKV
ncbi:hypothetical protein ZWY2020_015037 [Hordeum vulgare]|nr:hypothetical protein ZWY2020_015037 [Hordeum vulgare]